MELGIDAALAISLSVGIRAERTMRISILAKVQS